MIPKEDATFPLASDEVPQDAEALARALEEGLDRLLAPGGGPAPRVRAEGGGKPGSLAVLEIVLDGADFDPRRRPRPGSARKPGPVAGRFRLTGTGLRFSDSPIDLAIRGEEVRFEAAPAEGGGTILVPQSARAGDADLYLPRKSLEELFAKGIREGASRQGLKLEEVSLEIESEADGVRVRLLVTLKKVVSAKLRVAGHLAPVARAGLRITNVSCRGSGLPGAAVAKMARKRVEALEGREYSLAAFVPAGLSPRDVTVSVEKDGIRVRAVLGGSADSGG